MRDGQALLAQIYDALRNGPLWERTLFVITYDEWGGFYDHVAPPFAPISAAEANVGNDGRLGFRVPCAILGPRARRGHVSHIPFDPTSVINLIRWRWDLPGVGARADSSINLAHALDFENPPNRDAPDFGVPQSVVGFGTLCTDTVPIGLDPHNRELSQVLSAIRGFGFPI
ncbi:MAG: alkaline phosphatase family protein [Candidatus Binatia bacterium]